MSRRALGLALLLSVGLNVGVLAVLALDRVREPAAAETSAEPTTAPETSAGDPVEDPDVRTGPDRPDVPDELEIPPSAEEPPVPARQPVEDDPPAPPARAPRVEEPAAPAPRAGGAPVDEAAPRAAPPDPRGPARGTLFPGPARVEQRLERLADHLGLAGETRRRFLEVQRRFFGETLRGRRRVTLLQRRLRTELAAAAPDSERVATLVDTIAAERQRLDRTFARMVVDTRALLDPEQEREYQRFLARLGPGGSDRRPGGRQRPHGAPPGGPGPPPW